MFLVNPWSVQKHRYLQVFLDPFWTFLFREWPNPASPDLAASRPLSASSLVCHSRIVFTVLAARHKLSYGCVENLTTPSLAVISKTKTTMMTGLAAVTSMTDRDSRRRR